MNDGRRDDWIFVQIELMKGVRVYVRFMIHMGTQVGTQSMITVYRWTDYWPVPIVAYRNQDVFADFDRTVV